jgi:hypothetical protein
MKPLLLICIAELSFLQLVMMPFRVNIRIHIFSNYIRR